MGIKIIILGFYYEDQMKSVVIKILNSLKIFSTVSQYAIKAGREMGQGRTTQLYII